MEGFLEEKGVSISVAVIVSVIVTAIVVGGGAYLAAGGGGGAPEKPGEVTESDVKSFVEGTTDEATLKSIGQKLPQDILSQVSTQPRNVTFGWVTPSVIEGSSWNTSMKNALDWLSNEYPNVSYIKNTKVGPEDTPTVGQSMIDEEGADILIGNFEYTGLKFMSEGLTTDNPDKYFCINIAGSVKRTDPNAIRYFGREYQAIYLSGMVAGGLTETNHIGMVGAKQVAQVSRRMDAFMMGAKAVNPDVEMYVRWVNKWYDPTATTEVAKTLVEDYNCDVMSQQIDSSAAVEVAANKGIWYIGKDIDFAAEGWATGETVATSFAWHWETIMTRVLRDYLAGDETPKNLYFLGMDDTIKTDKGQIPPADLTHNGKVGLDAISDAAKQELSQDVLNQIETARTKMMKGTWDPYMEKIVASGKTKNWSDGEVVSPKGRMPSNKELLTQYYFVPGIHVP